MKQKVYIVGMGIVSSIGENVEETYQSLLKKKHGIKTMNLIDSNLKTKLPVAEVKYSNIELINKLGITSQDVLFSRSALLGMYAAKQAVLSATIDLKKQNRIGLFNGTSVGGMDQGEIFFKKYLLKDYYDYIPYALVHDCGDTTDSIANYLGINGTINTISTACSSSTNAIISASRMIKHNQLDFAIAGGTDSFSLFTLNGFNALKILSEKLCKPFDNNRNGLNLGEGAGYLILASETMVDKHGLTSLAELRGYGNACDAYHQTASSAQGNGAYLSMNEAINSSGIHYSDIQYINMHGTATPNNDFSEGIATKRVFENQVPKFSSTKAYTGHTLAASGSIEAIISILSLQNNVGFANLNFETPIVDLNIHPITEHYHFSDLKFVLSNSFGFGGNNSSLILSK